MVEELEAREAREVALDRLERLKQLRHLLRDLALERFEVLLHPDVGRQLLLEALHALLQLLLLVRQSVLLLRGLPSSLFLLLKRLALLCSA